MTDEAAFFAGAFEEIHGHAPYRWQQRLFAEVGASGWPRVVAVPTGAGKTAVLDIALARLALAPAAPGMRPPRRIVLAVDRRIIVDQAYRRALAIRDALDRPRGPRTRAIREALAALSGEAPLHVSELRGGLPREDAWARSPVQPTILCTTVDQLGSRLLFRGYGVSDAMAPIHAGLLGNDTLVLLDEAHLSTPFEETLDAVGRMRAAAEVAPALPFVVASLTATPRTESPDSACVFALSPEERAEDRLAYRLEAPKSLRLRPPQRGARRADGASARPDEDAASFIEAALDLARGDAAPRTIAVVVNRVALARQIHAALAEECAREATAEAILLTGRVRSMERDRLIDTFEEALHGRGADGSRLFVIATQCVEAGADFDLDAMVTQIAPLDALAQRLGRLNRAGTRKTAPAVVVALPSDIAARADDPIYGDRPRTTWSWLSARIEAADGALLVGPSALRDLIASDPEGAAACTMPSRHAPVLRGADVDFLSMTNPPPRPDPHLPLFLHGDPRVETDVSVVWRADLDPAQVSGDDEDRERRQEAAHRIVAALPPRPGEALSLTLPALRALIAGRRSTAMADVPGAEDDTPGAVSDRLVLRYRRDDSEIVSVAALRPGETIVLPAAWGGCDRFGWAPSSEQAVEDIADAAAAPFSDRRLVQRVHPDLWGRPRCRTEVIDWRHVRSVLSEARNENLGASSIVNRLIDLVDPRPSPESELAGTEVGDVVTRLAMLSARDDCRALWLYGEDDDGRPVGVVLAAGRAVAVAEDDDASSFEARALTLDAHADDVAGWVRRFAQALELSPRLAESLALAAALHDEGKRDPRFQARLRGGAVADDGLVLAKSVVAVDHARDRGARYRAGLPDPWRHEALSVRVAAQRLAARQDEGAIDPALVLWLIGTHHGQGRPFFRHVDPWDAIERTLGEIVLPPDPGPERLDFDWEGEDWAGLFDRMKARYGAWGLAGLEALLRLADHRASAEPAGGAEPDVASTREDVDA